MPKREKLGKKIGNKKNRGEGTEILPTNYRWLSKKWKSSQIEG